MLLRMLCTARVVLRVCILLLQQRVLHMYTITHAWMDGCTEYDTMYDTSCGDGWIHGWIHDTKYVTEYDTEYDTSCVEYCVCMHTQEVMYCVHAYTGGDVLYVYSTRCVCVCNRV